MKDCPDCARLTRENTLLRTAMQNIRAEINITMNDVDAVTMPVTTLELTVRACNVLRANNINTIGDLTALSARDLAALKGMGKRSIKEIVDTLADFKLDLRP